MKTPSTEMRHSRNEINWNFVWYYGSLVFCLYYSICTVLYFFGYDFNGDIARNVLYSSISLLSAYMFKPIKIPDGMERAEAETFVRKIMARRDFFRYTYFILLFAICGFLLIISFFDLGSII